MLRLGIGSLIAISLIAGLFGCGGGTGGSDPSGQSVGIEQYTIFGNPSQVRTRFVPKTASVIAGINNGITWINQSSGRHQIVSGVLTAQGDPSVIEQINITFGSFSPTHLEADAGNTIQVSNLSGRTFTMQVVDDNGQVVSTNIFAIGQMRTIVFPGPGVWVLQDPDSQLVATVTLYGHPVPDGQFQSGVLSHGGVFQAAFPVAGTFPYYDANPDDPTHVYTTGTIVAQ